jgi:alkanesulfonate monooxygenase SsuD/methylene tetrahydromethanopterin reductase-like flavin-dependent oxidoreductase (luciferase family)
MDSMRLGSTPAFGRNPSRAGSPCTLRRLGFLAIGLFDPQDPAASQRTSRIEPGTAVTPMGWENPLRLTEDLATVDLLSGGRLNPGLSVGTPMHYETVKHGLYPDSAESEDFGHARVQRLARMVAGEPVREFSGRQGVVEEFSNRVEPHAPDCANDSLYGAASLRSALWAGANGFNGA